MSDNKEPWREELNPAKDIGVSDDAIIDDINELEEDSHEETDLGHGDKWIRGPGGKWTQA
jgi:hypothetical protein